MGDQSNEGAFTSTGWMQESGYQAGDALTGDGTEGLAGDAAALSEPLGFWAQLWQSIVGVLFGFLFVGGAIFGIFWNENASVQVARALDEGLGVTIAASADRVDATNEGKLVHVTGPLASREGVRDDLLGLSGQGLRLVRYVEMYQWRESGSTNQGQRTYSYSREWSSSRHDSSRFRDAANHRNPVMPFSGQIFTAGDGMIGVYRLGAQAIAAFQSRSEIALPPPQVLVDAFGRRMNKPASIVDGKLYASRDPANPEIGDIRVSWRIVPVGPGSLAARQTAGELTAYSARNGRPVLLAATGTHSADAMFTQGQADNRFWTWILRAVLLFLMFVGFLMIMGPFTTLASYVPILGDIVAAGAAAIAFVLTFVVGGAAIAIAWFAVRPLLSLGILAVAVAGFMGMKYLNQGKAAQKQAARDARRAEALARQAQAQPTGWAQQVSAGQPYPPHQGGRPPQQGQAFPLQQGSWGQGQPQQPKVWPSNSGQPPGGWPPRQQ